MIQRTILACSFGAAMLVLVACSGAAHAAPIAVAEVKRDKPVDFEQEVLPILKRSCLACHNKSDKESDLVLETPASILKGGSLGPAVVPGKGSESLLIKVASHAEEPIMPPEKNDRNAPNLKPEELGLIKLWIDQGAKGEVRGAAALTWQPLPPGVNPIYAVAVSPDGRFVAAGRSNQVFLYDVVSGTEVGRLTDPELLKMGVYSNPGVAHLDLVQSLAFSPDGELLASGGYQVVKLWRRPQNVQLQKLAASGGTAMALSADGKLLALAAGNEIRILDAATGNATKTLQGHKAEVTALGFTPDGTKLYSGSADKSVRLWNLEDAKLLAAAETPGAVRALAVVGDDGASVATGGEGSNDILVWGMPAADAAETNEDGSVKLVEQRKLAGHGQPVTSLATQPNARAQIVSASGDGTARLWNATNGQALRTFSHGAPIAAVAITADGQRLATVSAAKTARLWNATNGQQIAEMKGDPQQQFLVARLTGELDLAKTEVGLSKTALDNAQKAVPPKDEALKKAAEALAAARKTLDEKKAEAKKVADERAALQKAFEAADAKLKAAQAAADKAKQDLDKDSANENLKKAKEAADKALAEAQKERQDAENKLKATDKPLADTAKAETDAQAAYDAAERAHQSAQRDVAAAKEAVPLAEAAVKEAEAWQARVEAALKSAQEAAAAAELPLVAVAFAPDGSELAVADEARRLRTYQGQTGQPLSVFQGHEGAVRGLAYVGSNRLASLGAEGSIIVWDTQPVWTLERVIGGAGSGAFEDRVVALDFSPDGQFLATGGGEPSRSGEVKIWKVGDGSLVRDIPDAHSDTVFSVSYSPDGKYLATGSADKFVKLFQVRDGKFLKSFEGHTHHVLGVGWRYDGRQLASCGADAAIKVWNVETGEQIRTINNVAAKQLTALRWVRFAPDGNLSRDDVLVSCGSNAVLARRTSNGGAIRTYGGAADFVYNLDCTPDGRVIAAGGQDSVLRVWNAAGQVLRTFEPPKPQPTAETAAR
jgi:WD40 repeat protein